MRMAKKQWAQFGKTTTLHVQKAFCTFLCRHCMATTWKCLISCFVEDVNTRQQLSFSFPELWYSLLEFCTCRKNANIWWIERGGISTINFDAVRIKFLSDVFVAFAGVAALTPYCVVMGAVTHHQYGISATDITSQGEEINYGSLYISFHTWKVWCLKQSRSQVEMMLHVGH